jgi:adenylyl cyclase-associated protein
MATSNLGSLTTLIKRLEAATSRLEDLADATADPEATQSGLGAGNKAGSASAPPPKPGNSSPPPTIAEPLPPAITGYDTFLNGDVKTFVAISQNLGGLVAEQVTIASTLHRQHHFADS